MKSKTTSNNAVNVSINDTQKRLMLNELSGLAREAQSQLDIYRRSRDAEFFNSDNPELWNECTEKADAALKRFRHTVELIKAVAAELD